MLFNYRSDRKSLAFSPLAGISVDSCGLHVQCNHTAQTTCQNNLIINAFPNRQSPLKRRCCRRPSSMFVITPRFSAATQFVRHSFLTAPPVTDKENDMEMRCFLRFVQTVFTPVLKHCRVHTLPGHFVWYTCSAAPGHRLSVFRPSARAGKKSD